MRHKEVHAINTHPSLKFALDFGMSLISEKIKKRVKIYTSLEEAINHKMDTSLLPKEYGGTMPMKEMIGKCVPSVVQIVIVSNNWGKKFKKKVTL